LHIPWALLLTDIQVFNTFAPGLIQAIHEKTAGSDVALGGNFSDKHYRPGQKLKRIGKSCSLHSKKIFWLGGSGFL